MVARPSAAAFLMPRKVSNLRSGISPKTLMKPLDPASSSEEIQRAEEPINATEAQ